MRKRPVLMHARSIKGIMEGRKSQTRRIVKPQPPERWTQHEFTAPDMVRWAYQLPSLDWHTVKCPYGQPGDRLWVRETWCLGGEDGKKVLYRATEGSDADCWRPSIHMPRWASRLTLEVANVRVERVQDISYSGITREGVIPELRPGLDVSIDGELSDMGLSAVRDQFKRLWDDTNGKGAWDRNDWVWVVEFKKS